LPKPHTLLKLFFGTIFDHRTFISAKTLEDNNVASQLGRRLCSVVSDARLGTFFHRFLAHQYRNRTYCIQC